jgi:acetylornithine deacetylase
MFSKNIVTPAKAGVPFFQKSGVVIDMSDVKEILGKLIAFDTTSRNSNRALIDFIRNHLDRSGIKSEIVPGEEEGKACLFATIGPGDKPGIVVSGHTDTVPVDGQNWSSDPFALTERDGKYFGRGACDMKGFIACALVIAPELAKAKLKKPVHLAFTHDEEVDMSGAMGLTDFMRTKGVMPEWVWIGEPTEYKIIDSHKGVAAFETKITGVPAHSGKPDKGLNAIELGNDFISILRAVAEEKRGNPFAGSRYDPAYTTINLGVVKGGTAENIVAENWELLWQTRQHPGDDHDAMLADIEHRAQQKLTPRFEIFKAMHSQVGCKTCSYLNVPPLTPILDNPGQKLLEQHTGNRGAEAASFGTEAGFFQKLGAAVVVCGPGSIDQAHKADEFVEIRQLGNCVDLMRSVLLSSGGS